MYHKQIQFQRIGEWSHRNKNLVKTPIVRYIYIYLNMNIYIHLKWIYIFISVVGKLTRVQKKSYWYPTGVFVVKSAWCSCTAINHWSALSKWETFHISLKFTYPLNKHQTFLKCIKYFSAFLSWLFCYLCFFWLRKTYLLTFIN